MWLLQFIHQFGTYVSWGIEFLLIPPFVSVTKALSMNLLAAVAFSGLMRRERWRHAHWGMLRQFYFAPALTAVAIHLEACMEPSFPRATDGRTALALCTIISMGIVSLIVGVRYIRLMVGLRWLGTSIMLFQLWVLYGVSIVAGMAISGDWI